MKTAVRVECEDNTLFIYSKNKWRQFVCNGGTQMMWRYIPEDNNFSFFFA